MGESSSVLSCVAGSEKEFLQAMARAESALAQPETDGLCNQQPIALSDELHIERCAVGSRFAAMCAAACSGCSSGTELYTVQQLPSQQLDFATVHADVQNTQSQASSVLVHLAAAGVAPDGAADACAAAPALRRLLAATGVRLPQSSDASRTTAYPEQLVISGKRLLQQVAEEVSSG